MLKKIIFGVILVVLFALGGDKLAHVQAQGTTPLNITVSATHTSCLAPTTGQTTFCFASDGLWQSLSGGAYAQLTPAAPAGVSSVTVCNMAGANCGTAQTGSVTLKIPSTAVTTTTSTAPNTSTTATSTTTAPTVTSTTTLQ